MSRAPFQVLVFPYRPTKDGFLYAIFSRSDHLCWQGIAGGGELGETPLETARRECWEEAGIPQDSDFIQIDTVNSIPAYHFGGSEAWGEETYVIPEYCFGVEVGEHEMRLSREHLEYKWVTKAQADQRLEYDSNRTALWELNQRLQHKGPRD